MPIIAPAVFTDSQLQAFYTRIRLPTPYCHSINSPELASTLTSPIKSFDLLAAIIRHTLATVPFENLALHYSPHHTVSISPSFLYNKIVSSNPETCHRGGYCMENNNLVLTVLRTLGFDVYPVGAKINESVSSHDRAVPYDQLKYGGWSHMVNLVTLPLDEGGEGTFLCDVGFGAGGPARPMLVQEGLVVSNMPGKGGAREESEGAQLVRLTREKVTQTTRGRGVGNEMWVFARMVEGGEFRPFYAFTEQEFFPEDFAIMNHSSSTSRTSWFTFAVVCLRKILDEEEKEVVGEIALFDRGVKKRMYGETVETREFKTEDDRIRALREMFDIELSEEEIGGIKGMVSMVK
ncbi:hypothetical protein KVT40_006859 [Elsinoe batatas]|uniref:Arylamine N-acetyltransferase n=1 Tax=Elsinoe batatas TaxID=2601811 RepID=A0A8K0PFC0_9PEZI|nr:hypothetical protein KVT40_006859 [Elsinoe batatas]